MISTSLLWADPRDEIGSAALDGCHIALGPVAAATRVDGRWDGIYGVEAGFYRVREAQRLAAIGASAGAAWLSEADGGRGWLQLEAATQVGGLSLGGGVGPALAFSDVQHPRLGVQASLWLFAGVVPYIRAGHIDGSESYAELGLRILLPTLRW